MFRILFIRFIGFCLTPMLILPSLIRLLKYPFSKDAKLLVTPRDYRLTILNEKRWGEHKYILLDNGIKIHYVEKGDPACTMMLFLHGFPEFWFSWRHQIEHFSKKYWCIAPDNRGYGDSDKPYGINNYHINMLVDDVMNLVKGLGRQNCILVGHDWGGIIGYKVSEKYPEIVQAYIAINIAHPASLTRHMQSSWREYLRMHNILIMMFQCPWIPERILTCGDLDLFNGIVAQARLSTNGKNENVEEVIEAFKYTFSKCNSFAAPLNYYRSFRQVYETENHNQSTKIIVPVLSIYGTADKAISQSAAEGSADFVDKFKSVLLEGVTHWSQEDSPDTINTEIDNYLEGSE